MGVLSGYSRILESKGKGKVRREEISQYRCVPEQVLLWVSETGSHWDPLILAHAEPASELTHPGDEEAIYLPNAPVCY